IFRPATLATVVVHERIASLPSRWTVQAPHSDIPHPNLVPVRPIVSRSTQSSGVCGSTSSVWSFPLTVIWIEELAGMRAPLRCRDGEPRPGLRRTNRSDSRTGEAVPSRRGALRARGHQRREMRLELVEVRVGSLQPARRLHEIENPFAPLAVEPAD